MQHNLLLHEQVTKSNQCSTSGGVSCFSITLNSLTPALHYLPISSAKAINSWRSYCFSAFSSRQNSYVLTLYHFKVRPFLTMRERKQIPYEKSSDLWVNIHGFSGRYSSLWSLTAIVAWMELKPIQAASCWSPEKNQGNLIALDFVLFCSQMDYILAGSMEKEIFS
jgi:hypothetical protein